MFKKLTLLSLNIIILIIGVLWYLSDKGYEPLIVITGSFVSLLSFSGVLVDGFDDISQVILKLTNKNSLSGNTELSNEIINSSKKFDSYTFYIKKTTSYITSALIIIALFQTAIVSSELREMTNDQIITQIEQTNPGYTEIIKDNSDAVIYLFAHKAFNNKYSIIFLLLSLFSIIMHIFLFDLINRFIYNSYSKMLGAIKDDDKFIRECRDINSELIHYRFKNSDIPEMLRLSITQAFSNLYLNNIKYQT